MKFTTAAIIALASVASAVPSAQQNARSVSEIMSTLKRDPTGQGFTHVGSDNVVRTYDSNFNIIDSAPLSGRSYSGNWPRSPSADVVEEARAGKERSLEHTSKPRARSVLEAKQTSCVAQNCPNDAYCQSLNYDGIDCGSCLIVSDGIGNCQDA